MLLEKLVKKTDALRIHEERSRTDKLYEIVFYSEDLDQWTKLLEAEFGLPIKAKGEPLPAMEQNWISATGGVWKDQTLYGKIINRGIAVAKLQPWKDGSHITLKVAVITQKKQPR